MTKYPGWNDEYSWANKLSESARQRALQSGGPKKPPIYKVYGRSTVTSIATVQKKISDNVIDDISPAHRVPLSGVAGPVYDKRCEIRSRVRQWLVYAGR